MYCPKCGKKNDDDSGYCVECAEPLRSSTMPASTSGAEISSHLVPAILCTLFCCLPFGIVAIVYAAQVNPKLKSGDFPGAAEASHKAAVWCWVSFGIGLAGVLFYLAMMVLGAAASTC